jgi:hypothetical protein
MTNRKNKRLEWPGCPIRNESDERISFYDNSFVLSKFFSNVIAQKACSVIKNYQKTKPKKQKKKKKNKKKKKKNEKLSKKKTKKEKKKKKT